MRSTWIIASNTYREIIRDRILYSIVIFALLLIGLSIALGQLSFAEQARISANFGFTGIQMSAAVLAVFIGSSLVAKEIEKQTILTLLARPISRTQFLLGKFFGLILVILTVMAGLSAVLALVIGSLDFKIETSYFIALYGILLEAFILLAFALFFGTFARPIMTVLFTGSLFLIGHWTGSLKYFVEKSQGGAFKVFGTFLMNVLPDLEAFNWRSAPIYNIEVPAETVFRASGYAGGWLLFLLLCTSIIFKRRDFI